MMKFFVLVIILFLFQNSFAMYHSEGENPDSINDGPYIFKVNDQFKVKWVENSVLKEFDLIPKNFPGVKKNFHLLCNYKDLTDTYKLKTNFSHTYKKIDSISVISDVHGEYNIYIDMLKAMGIIDENLNWKFGKGHLVILGDIFDRGDMVTEAAWHVFGLEKQAAKAGGMVHVLLGNHEVLVLNGDLRYINKKYKKVEAISNTTYCDLYSENSVLGKWLRFKPVVITINDIIFVHAGISIEMVQRNLKFKQINQIFSDSIVGKKMESIYKSQELTFLSEEKGPLWYRGFFTDRTFCESRLDSILDFYEKKYIVVGHTFKKEIESLYNRKIFGIDAGIMYKQPGEMLIYKNGIFYKGLIDGRRIKL